MKRITSILALILVSTFGLGATGCALEDGTDGEAFDTTAQALTRGDVITAGDDDPPVPQTREHVLVAAASEPGSDESVMPQTREHVLLAASTNGQTTGSRMPQTKEHVLLATPSGSSDD